MNERIKELAEQARDWGYAEHSGYTAQMLFEQKFAELIVRECVEQIIIRERADGECYQYDIFKYFGVEE